MHGFQHGNAHKSPLTCLIVGLVVLVKLIMFNRSKRALFDIYAREKSGKELFRTKEKCSESGLYEHLCESKGEGLGFRCKN